MLSSVRTIVLPISLHAPIDLAILRRRRSLHPIRSATTAAV
jgi:hypothetical protein